MNRFLLLLLLFNTGSFAQETKLIIKKSSDFSEEYYVLKDDESIKHGKYIKHSDGRVFEFGSYQNGQKNGIWEYFYERGSYSNSIKERGAFIDGKKNGVWAYYYGDNKPDIKNQWSFGNKQRTDSIDLIVDYKSAKLRIAGLYINDQRKGEWNSFDNAGLIAQKYNFSKQLLLFDRSLKDSLEYNRNHVPLFIGGLPCLNHLSMYEFKRWEVADRVTKDSTLVIVVFKIDKNGNVHDVRIDQSNGNKMFENEAIRIASFTDNYWIPARSNAEKIDSTCKIQILIKREKEPLGHSKLIRFNTSFE